MRLQMPIMTSARGRPPGDRPDVSAGSGPRLASHRGRTRITTLAGVALALGLCAVAGCALFVPGFVLGAEAPIATVPEPAAGLSAGVPAEPPTDSPAEPSTGALLATLPWGAGEDEVGLVRPAEGLARGPEALAIAPSGRVAVLDSVNKHLLLLDADGHPSGTAEVPLAEPRFLAVDDDRLYVLDCDAHRQILVLSWDGTVLDTVAMPELPDVVTGLFATEAGPCVEVAHDSVFLLASDLVLADGPDGHAAAASRGVSLRSLAGRPLDRALSRAAKVTFAPASGLRMRFFKIERNSLKATKLAESSPALAPGRTVEHLVSVDGDGGEGLIVGARVLEAEVPGAAQFSRGVPANLLLTRFDSKGRGRGVTDELVLAESSFAYLGLPYVVAPDGRVFQPVADESGYSILVHSFATAEAQSAKEEVLP
jgi:hypothetical protein